ncbi:glycosyltransferase [Halomonas getboli]|uniref:glycosyltransferase n=1 Tax=Halomonas getboli TaxID=2935862 RepID=UPI001FFEAEA6|nr:glycosyltransferase [Halomonas getboli]
MAVFKIAHVGDFYSNRVTGPRNSVTCLSRSLNLINGVVSDVFSLSEDCEFVFNEQKVSSACLRKIIQYDAVVFSSFYSTKSVSMGRSLVKAGVPYFISPRSSFMKEGLRKSYFKKKAFNLLKGRRFVQQASGLHFLTREEYENSSRFFRKGVPFFCPNGVYSKSSDGFLPKPVLKEAMVNGGEIVLGFLGRYDTHHKGLDILLKALFECSSFMRDKKCRIVLYGPDYRNGKEKIKKLISGLGIGDLVEVNGPLFGAEKDEFYRRCDFFLHTSRYEGQPQAVMDAMALGVPVLVSKGTNLVSYINEYDAGFDIGKEASEVSEGIIRAVSLDGESYKKKSENSFLCASQNFCWDEAAKVFYQNMRDLSGK